MTPVGLLAYRALTAAASPFLPAILRGRAARGREDEARMGERLGHASVARPAGPLVWLHGASVGEGLSLLPLIERLLAADAPPTVLVTSGTVTSAKLLGARLPPGAIHQFAPVDTPGASRRFLDHWRPDAAAFAESEIWPGLLIDARRRGVRTALISARLSTASLTGWTRSRAVARAVFAGFDLVLAQDDAVAAGLVALGARDDGRLNLKLAGDPLPFDALALAEASEGVGGRPVLLAASTHPGEDEIVLDAFAQAAGAGPAILVIVPRHPDRGPAVAELATARGHATSLRSAGDPLRRDVRVHVADTLGELGLWYALAAENGAAVVCGSLLPGPGGHNPLEPARQECPIIRGPHVQNWSDVYARLGDATLLVENAGQLAAAFRWEPEDVQARVDRAGAIARDAGEGVETAAAALLRLLDQPAAAVA